MLDCPPCPILGEAAGESVRNGNGRVVASLSPSWADSQWQQKEQRKKEALIKENH
jgi:DNA-binding IclR family transcriptional regulator